MNVDVFVENEHPVHVTNTKEDKIFSGDNSEGNDFSYKNVLLKEYRIKSIIDSIFQTKDTKRIEQIVENPKLLIQSVGYFEKLDSMYRSRIINENCYYYLTNEMDYYIRSRLLNKFRNDIKKGISMNDSIKSYVNKLTKGVLGDNNLEYYSSGNYFNELYCTYEYNQLDNNAKASLFSKFDRTTFGAYSRFLLVNDNAQLSLFFDAFIIQYKFGVNEFDKKKLYNYLNNKYPKSESVKLLKQYMAEELKDTLPFKPIYLESKSINKFSDLQKTDGLRNKYILIDIWASWCMPCRAELTNNKKLNVLLAKYCNIEKLYISIDDNLDNWKNAIKELNLSGYHLTASNNLSEILKKEVYKSNLISVPQYILLDLNGKIINANLPRPSSIDKLEVELDRYLK